MKVMMGSFTNVRFLLISVFFTVSIFLTACGQEDPLLDAAGEDGNPLVEDFAIAYIKRPVGSLDTTRGPRSIPAFPVELDNNDPEVGITPGDVYVRDLSSPSAAETNVTSLITAAIPGVKSAGDVSDLEVSYDGTKLVFSLHEGMYAAINDDADQPRWNIYEFDVTQPVILGTNPRKMMNDLEAQKGHDIDPHYLPDGRIVFISDRQTSSRGLQAITGLPTTPTLDEERRDPAFVLHIMDATGDNIKQLSFNQSHELNPTVLKNGKILFTRWERTGPRDAFSLYTINPDGTGLEMFYGAHSHDPATSERAFVNAKQMQNGQLISTIMSYDRPRTLLPNMVDEELNHFNDGELVIIDQANFIEIDEKRFTSTSPGTVGQSSATRNEVPRNGDFSQYGRYYSPHPIWEEGGGARLLVAWTVCRLTDLNEIIRLPCIQENIDNASYKEADPFFGIYLFDLTQNLKKPIVNPVEGIAIVDPVAMINIPYFDRPAIIPDQSLDAALAARSVGVIHIKSVYDTQGDVAMVDKPLEPRSSTTLTAAERSLIPLTTVNMDPLTGAVSTDTGRNDLIPRTVADISVLRDPMQTLSNQRVARFVRITKAVPTIDDDNIDADDFGRSGGYEMREILGYAPVEPDGSVYTEVPAEVPFTIEVLDAKGRSLMAETTWQQLMPGEVRECNGCHSPRDGQQTINPGAPGSQFPNTDDVLSLIGETMAEARARQDAGIGGTFAQLDMDIVDNNIWVTPDELTEFPYLGVNGLSTPSPVSDSACETDWNWVTSKCRINITYEQHIQPVWDATRMRDLGAGVLDYRCTSCHNDDDPNVVPAGHLALDGSLDINPNHVTVQLIRDNRTDADRPASYEMLFVTRPRMEAVPTGGTRFIVQRDPVTDQPIDVDGNIIGEADFGNLQFINQRPGMVSGGVARARFSRLVQVITGDQMRLGDLTTTPTIDHTLLLTDGEKRLIIEWIDNGGQVTNDPNVAALQ
ncbi:HzsA-related protein [Kaarinaea lacus]